MEYMNALRHRRSIYALGKKEVLARPRVEELVREAVTHTPSAFNSQSSRTVLLFGEESDKLWSLVGEALKPLVPPESFGKTLEKLQGFAKGYGTILFFEDQSVVEGLQGRFPLYAEKFPLWSAQSNGMLEFAVWTALESEGLGASLQHYNPVIDEAVRKAWNLPDTWKLYAQMPFGSVEAPAGEKEFLPLADRIRVF